jgi:hypothetical protein
LSSSSSSFIFFFGFALVLQTTTKKRQKINKNKGIPSVMRIINYDATSNGNNRCNDAMKEKKCLKKKIKNRKRRR